MTLITCPGCSQTISDDQCPHCGFERNYIEVQFLGTEGTTEDCIKAIVAVLASPFKCSSITALFCRKGSGEEDDIVCFVVWDWIKEITIIRNGFAVNGFTGRTGLAHVFYLINLYQIPLFQKRVDMKFFDRISHGYITLGDREPLRKDTTAASFLVLDYPYPWHTSKKLLWDDFHLRYSIPYWLLEPEFYQDVREFTNNQASAVFKVAQRLEMIIREACQLPSQMTGELLVAATLGKEKPLEPRGEAVSEVRAWVHLFQGVIGSFREHPGNKQEVTVQDAIEQILALNMLLRKLKKDYPEKFPKKQNG